MLLILSEEKDLTTNEVIDWLYFYNINFIRINKEDNIVIKEIKIINGVVERINIFIKNRNIELDLAIIKAYWYRRGNFPLNFEVPQINHKYFLLEIENYLSFEKYKILDLIHEYLKDIKGIGCIYDDARNKLIHLQIAAKFGIKVPDTIITTDKSSIQEFQYGKVGIITKAVGEGMSFFSSEFKVLEYTSLINEPNNLPEAFFPSLIQEKIEKKYDLRIFYLDRKFYSSAIISQNDSQTTTDFRRYNMEKSNRVIPFKLPDYIEKQLDEMMNQLNYLSDSIDMVYTKEKEFVFLEINPVGQFAQVSEPCNYYLEKKVADYFNNIFKD